MVKISEAASCLYNTARFALTHIEQSMPAASRMTSLKVQKIICFLDCIDLSFTAHRVYTQLTEKYPRHIKKIPQFALPCMFALAGSSYVFTKTLSRLSIPSIDLQAVLKTISSIPKDEMKNIAVSWGRPTVYKVIQALFFARIVLNLASAALSSKPYASLLNSAMQIASLYNTSRLRWIQFVRTFDHPFGTIPSTIAKGGTLKTFQETVKKIGITFYARIPNTTSTEQGGHSSLKSTISSMYNLSNEIFKGSTWSRFWFRSHSWAGLSSRNHFRLISIFLAKKEDYSSQRSVPTYWQTAKEIVKSNVFGMGPLYLKYKAVLKSGILQEGSTLNLASVEAHVLHEDQVWKPFQLIDFKAGKFFVWGHMAQLTANIPLDIRNLWPE